MRRILPSPRARNPEPATCAGAAKAFGGLAAGFLAAIALTLGVPVAGAEPPPFSAAAGEPVARSAALSWADDARLVYVENDELLRNDGTAVRWGYLYWSGAKGEARAYSIRGEEIRTAETLEFDFEAPPLPERWVDSSVALERAESRAGRDFRARTGGTLGSMVLVRGLLDPEEANRTTWAVVYESTVEPPLWVMVDAETGKVVRTWRG